MSTPVRSPNSSLRQSGRTGRTNANTRFGSMSVRGAQLVKLLAPWHWHIWMLFGCSWFVARLPLKAQYWLGRSVARLFFKLVPRRERIIRKNVELAFPDLDNSQRESLVNETIGSLGMTMVETLFVWMRGIDPLLDRVNINGIEHLQTATDEETSGIVILGAHFSSLDLVAAALSKKCRFAATYRKARNPVIDFVCHGARQRYYDEMFEATNLRTLAQSLRNGKIVWFASDQDMGTRKSTCFVPFFGIDASTVVTPFRLARKTGSRVLFMSHKRNADDLSWELSLTPVNLADATEPGCYRQDAMKVNELIESFVRSAPEQYFWVHRRFKSMANGSRRDYQTP